MLSSENPRSHKMFSIRKPCPHCKGEIPTFRKVTANSLN